MKFNTAIIISFLFLADFCAAQPGVLDISKFGGKPNSDITQVYIILNHSELAFEKTIILPFRQNTDGNTSEWCIYIYIYTKDLDSMQCDIFNDLSFFISN